MKAPYAWLKILPNHAHQVILPSKKQFSISAHGSHKITIGHRNIEKPTNLKNLIGKETAIYPVQIKKIEDQYKVGPIVGILTVTGKQGFKGNRNNFQDIIKFGMKYGVLVYLFTVEDINKEDKSIKAFLYLPNKNRWIKRIMPLPDVVYNRIPFRLDENRHIVNETFFYLNEEGIPFFNPRFFNKWTLYQWLSESQELKKFLPETVKFTKENLAILLEKYSSVYLKPVNGKAGIGFIKIVKKNKIYHLAYQSKKLNHFKTFNDFDSLCYHVMTLVNNKNYIIQSTIHLSTFNGQPYDIRILVQKNLEAKWEITGIGIRVAGVHSISTHVPRGGHIKSVNQVFDQTFGPENREKWKGILSDLAIKIAGFIEEMEGQYLGEMSLDIGIDHLYHIWFFEANAKPMEFDEPAIRKASLQSLIQQFIYLSDFDGKGEIT